MHARVKSDFLFAQPSLVSGVARLLDFYGQFDAYNSSTSEAEADFRAALSDWYMVGKDISDAMESVETSQSLQYDLFSPAER